MDASNPTKLPPYNWIKDANIYNKNYALIPPEWIEANADIVVVLFISKNVDREGIVQKFYNIYESVKHANVPLEVIHVPLDENKLLMRQSFEQQANWFTLLHDDPLVLILTYLYEVSYIPYVVVIKPDGTIVSNTGNRDLEQYGKNAVIAWLPPSACVKHTRKLTDEAPMYGSKWRYLIKEEEEEKKEYPRRFTTDISKNSARIGLMPARRSEKKENAEAQTEAE
ncbi:uncharacterized protein LOC134751066 [Cydia strobilella]|uniref:uncharacterized protein LOC134751066 n=1 Tax=Cydia strobilella TaxID=1100964 RepID=UPI0030047178